jgi:hypothetical protein
VPRSQWYEDWREDLRKAGVERHATDVQGARLDKAVGYQSIATLMQKGHGYAPDMLEVRQLRQAGPAAQRSGPLGRSVREERRPGKVLAGDVVAVPPGP